MSNFADEPAVKNPATKFYKWSSKKEGFYYYDKESKKEVALPTPAHCIVLDDFSAVTGYLKKYKSGLTSNEVSNMKEEVLRLRTFNGEYKYEGLWHDIKDFLPNGAKYSKNLYALLCRKGNSECIHLEFSGAASGTYFDIKLNNRTEVLVIKDEVKEQTTGDNVYNVPVLDKVDMVDEYIDEAKEKALQVRDYFESKKPKSGEQG